MICLQDLFNFYAHRVRHSEKRVSDDVLLWTLRTSIVMFWRVWGTRSKHLKVLGNTAVVI